MDTRKQNSILKKRAEATIVQWFSKIKILPFNLNELSSKQDTTTQTIGKVTGISVHDGILCP